MEEQNKNPEEEKQEVQENQENQQGMPTRSYILMLMAGLYLLYTGYKLCKNVLDGVEGGSWGFFAAGIGFLIVGIVMLVISGKNLMAQERERKALEAEELKKQQEAAPKPKNMSISERARLAENLSDAQEVEEETETKED